MKPCAGLPPPVEGGALSGSAPAVVRHAVWKAAISTAADLRATLAAGAMGAS
jgi:ribosomal protein S9